MVMTRKEYLEENSTTQDTQTLHHNYYAQFVTDGTIAHVARYIGRENILNSKDYYMNDIPLVLWDNMANTLVYNVPAFREATNTSSFTQNGKTYHYKPSLGDMVCIAKTAARIWKERNL